MTLQFKTSFSDMNNTSFHIAFTLQTHNITHTHTHTNRKQKTINKRARISYQRAFFRKVKEMKKWPL